MTESAFRVRAASLDEQGFVASLNVQTRFARLVPGVALERVEELFQRTTQFNTTGAKFPVAVLDTLLAGPDAAVFTAHVSDRFGDHGLVGAAVVEDAEITGLALSCRVLGLGVEHRFLAFIIDSLRAERGALAGRIVETSRNGPVRHLFSDNGFTLGEDHVWRRSLD